MLPCARSAANTRAGCSLRRTALRAAGALRAQKPNLLTVVLPQSLSKQPQESQELLAKVGARAAPPPVAGRQAAAGLTLAAVARR